jgi:hypothetical protein
MPTLQYRQWTRPLSASLLSISVLAGCGGPGSPEIAMAGENTQSSDRQEAALDDGCRSEKSRFASMVDWMICVGAALGPPLEGEANDPSSFMYASKNGP